MRKITVTLDDEYDASWRGLVNELAARLGTVPTDTPDEGWMLEQISVLTKFIKAAENERDMYAVAAAPHRTWDEIGTAMGISRQAAHKRYGRFVRS